MPPEPSTLDAMDLPKMCKPGSRVDRVALFATLVEGWRLAARQEGRPATNRALALELQPLYPTVRVQRISNWLQGTGVRSSAPDDVLMYLCWKQDKELLISPAGVFLREAHDPTP